jgi:hypothetical protein
MPMRDLRQGRPMTVWTGINQWFGRYRIVWWVIVTALLALGFDFKTPAAQFAANRAKMDTVTKRVDSIVRAAGSRELINAGLARYFCFKDRSAAALFLPCAALNSGGFPP